MARFVRLTDTDVSRIAQRYSSGRERALVESALQIAIRMGGNTVSVEFLDEVLGDLTRNLLSDSIAANVSNAIEKEYDEQQEAAA